MSLTKEPVDDRINSALTFLRQHFRVGFECLGDSFLIEYRMIRGEEERKISLFSNYSEIPDVLPGIYPLIEQGWNAYFGVNPRPVSKRKTERDIEHVICLFVDLDVGEGKPYRTQEEAQAALGSFPLRPNCIVASGAGFHAYWHLKVPSKIHSEEDRIRLKRLLCFVKGKYPEKSSKSTHGPAGIFS